MKVVSVIPITNTPIPETLSYFSREELIRGQVIRIPVGNKTMLAIVEGAASLSAAKASIKKSEFAMRKLDGVSAIFDLGSDFVDTLEETCNQYLTPIHHAAFSLFSKSMLEFLERGQKLASVQNIIICPTWRQVEFLYNNHHTEATVLHGNLTAKQQSVVLSNPNIQTLITTPSYAYAFLASEAKVSVEFPASTHYYRHRHPFLDLIFFIKLLAQKREIQIKEKKEPAIIPEAITYEQINDKQEFNYTLVIHTDILLKIKALLEDGQKILMISPRKGFAAGVVCLDCRKTALDDGTGEKMKVTEQVDGFYYESTHNKKVARHTCQYCNGTRLQMFGFGTEALEKVLTRNFSKYPLHVINQATGKRAIKQANEAVGGVILSTGVAMWHLEPHSYHTVLLGLEFRLGIPSFDQTRQVLELISQCSNLSRTVYIPTQRASVGQISEFVNQNYDKIAKADTGLRQQFCLPPFGHLLTTEAILYQSAVESIVATLSKLSENPNYLIESRPSGPHSKKILVSFSHIDYLEVVSISNKIRQILPTAIIKINPRSD